MAPTYEIDNDSYEPETVITSRKLNARHATTWTVGKSMITPTSPDELVEWLDSRLAEVHQIVEGGTQ